MYIKFHVPNYSKVIAGIEMIRTVAMFYFQFLQNITLCYTFYCYTKFQDPKFNVASAVQPHKGELLPFPCC
jgi:hypothetical protein